MYTSTRNHFDRKYEKVHGGKALLWGLKPNFITKTSLKCLKGNKILDLGVGEGRDALFLAKRGFTVTGVDISAVALGVLKQKAHQQRVKLRLKHSLIEDFSYPEKQDAIYSLNALHFIKRKDIKKVISTMKENTSENGVNVIKVFTVKDPSYPQKKNKITYFKENELKSFYTNWKIVHYDEYLTKLEKHGKEGKWHHHGIAELIAVKLSIQHQ